MSGGPGDRATEGSAREYQHKHVRGVVGKEGLNGDGGKERELSSAMLVACDELIRGMEVDEEAASLVKPRSGVARASTAGSGRIVSATTSQPGPSAEALAERAQGGCRESFEELVLRHEDRIFNFLHQFTRNRH